MGRTDARAAEAGLRSGRSPVVSNIGEPIAARPVLPDSSSLNGGAGRTSSHYGAVAAQVPSVKKLPVPLAIAETLKPIRPLEVPVDWSQ